MKKLMSISALLVLPCIVSANVKSEANSYSSTYVKSPALFKVIDLDIKAVTPVEHQGKNIITKFVNKEFQFEIKNVSGVHNAGKVKFALFEDKDASKKVTEWEEFDTTNSHEIHTFKVGLAEKNVSVGFKVCASYDSSTKMFTLYDYSKCSNTTLDSCTKDGGPSLRMCFLSDDFAIIPYAFRVNASSDNKAQVHVKFEALDYEGNDVPNYNESVGDTFDVTYSETKTYHINGAPRLCNQGEFNYSNNDINTTNAWSFNGGVADLDLNYSDTGNVKITIKDKLRCEERFNNVDCKDYKVSYLSDIVVPKIKDSDTIVFIPINHFDADISLNNFDNKDFTYLANNINEMNASIKIDVTAKNYLNEVAQNYFDKCYSKDVQISLKHNKLDSYFSDINTTNGHFSADSNLTFFISASQFTEPTTSTEEYFNLNRKIDTPVEPQEFEIVEAKVTNEDGVDSNNKFNNNVKFYYGYVFIPKNVVSYADDVNSRIAYEYYKNGTFVSSQGHVKAMGDIKNIVINDITYSVSAIDPFGREVISYSYNGPKPYSTIAHLDIPEYLWYSPENHTYIIPEDDNASTLVCTNHPCQKITFYSNSKGWGGINAKSAPSKFNANESTIKMNSFRDVNTTKHPMPRVIW